MSSLIGHTNLVKASASVITVTSEAAGFEKENAQSWKTSSWWQAAAAGTVRFNIDLGSALAIDCWGVAGHDLTDNAGTIQVQHSTNGAWAGEELDFDTIQTPSENETIFRSKASQTKRYWSFEVASTGAASFIGNLFLGVALTLENGMPAGFSPANLNRDRKIFNNKSNGGAYLGRILRYNGAKVMINQRNISRTWIDANWPDLADHIELYPFYFLWDDVNHLTEAAYCMANDITYPDYADPIYLGFKLDCVAIYDR